MGIDLIRIDELESRLNSDSNDRAFSNREIRNVLLELERQNKVLPFPLMRLLVTVVRVS